MGQKMSANSKSWSNMIEPVYDTVKPPFYLDSSVSVLFLSEFGFIIRSRSCPFLLQLTRLLHLTKWHCVSMDLISWIFLFILFVKKQKKSWNDDIKIANSHNIYQKMWQNGMETLYFVIFDVIMKRLKIVADKNISSSNDEYDNTSNMTQTPCFCHAFHIVFIHWGLTCHYII